MSKQEEEQSKQEEEASVVCRKRPQSYADAIRLLLQEQEASVVCGRKTADKMPQTQARLAHDIKSRAHAQQRLHHI